MQITNKINDGDDCDKKLARAIQGPIHQQTPLESRYSECSPVLSPIISNAVMIHIHIVLWDRSVQFLAGF